jgi:hypothetical protein
MASFFSQGETALTFGKTQFDDRLVGDGSGDDGTSDVHAHTAGLHPASDADHTAQDLVGAPSLTLFPSMSLNVDPNHVAHRAARSLLPRHD